MAEAQIAEEIPLGIEGVTGIRSGYLFRGVKLANSSIDFQVEAEVVLSQDSTVNFGFAHLAASSSSFSETAGYLELTRIIDKKLSLGASLTYRDRHDSLLESGVDLGLFLSYAIDDQWMWRNELNYDFGEETFYFASEIEWSYVVSKDSFLALKSGVSAVSDFLGREGLNDFYSRITFTYALSDRVAVTPFLGSSVALDREGEDSAYAGFWFEVNF